MSMASQKKIQESSHFYIHNNVPQTNMTNDNCSCECGQGDAFDEKSFQDCPCEYHLDDSSCGYHQVDGSCECQKESFPDAIKMVIINDFQTKIEKQSCPEYHVLVQINEGTTLEAVIPGKDGPTRPAANAPNTVYLAQDVIVPMRIGTTFHLTNNPQVKDAPMRILGECGTDPCQLQGIICLEAGTRVISSKKKLIVHLESAQHFVIQTNAVVTLLPGTSHYFGQYQDKVDCDNYDVLIP